MSLPEFMYSTVSLPSRLLLLHYVTSPHPVLGIRGYPTDRYGGQDVLEEDTGLPCCQKIPLISVYSSAIDINIVPQLLTYEGGASIGAECSYSGCSG